MKFIKTLVVVFLLIIILSVVYMLKFQSFFNEAATLQNEKCVAIDPIIDSNGDYLLQLGLTPRTSDNTEEIEHAREGIIKVVNEHINAFEPWLVKEDYLLNRWDSKLYLNGPFGDSLKALHLKHLGDYRVNLAVKELISATEKDEYETKLTEIMGFVELRNKAQNEAIKKSTIAEKSFDIRIYLIEQLKKYENKCGESKFYINSPLS